MITSDSVAPTFEQMRPMKPLTTATFPVYARLSDALAAEQSHPDDVAAHVLATCAGYAYSDSDTVSMIMARMGLPNNHCRAVTENVDAMFICSSAFVVQSEDGRVVVVCYRGTEPSNFINWLTDADVNPERVALAFPGADAEFAVHGGFYRNVRATRYEVIAAVQRALDGHSVGPDGGPMPNKLEALYVTGHSLGAAMAALLAIMLVTEPTYAPLAAVLRAVYTFGQPMIGSPELAKACNAHPLLGSRVLRYVYGHDIVPQLPPSESGPFMHFGPERQYHSSDGKGAWNEATSPTKQLGNLLELFGAPLAFLARQIKVLRGLTFHASLDDHGPQHYIAALTPTGVRTEFGD